MFRHQLPAYSPLTLGGIVRAMFTAGPEAVERLRERLKERFDARRAVLCGSGTQALTLALRSAAPPGRPPLVALPAYGCFDLVSAAVGADASVMFYDLLPESLSPEPESLTAACAAGPDAVVIAPLYGIPVDWEMVERVVRPSGALLVEDAAQGIGATWEGRPLGSLGDVSILSFGRGKGWTGGGGGALLERSPHTPAPQPPPPKGNSAVLPTKALAQWALGRPALYGIPASIPWLGLGETVYRPPIDAVSVHGFTAALTLLTEALFLDTRGARKGTAAALEARIQAVQPSGAIKLIRSSPRGDAGFLRLPVLSRRGFAGFSAPRRAMVVGIMPGYPRPLPDVPAAAARFRHPPGSRGEGMALPGADRLAAELITLPTHAQLTTEDQDRIVETMARYET